ncbi:MAG: glycoside hydrolase family 3 protein [Acidimicrobiia bacterium]|nr:glycoside hydrolase family 3 protein [Acidimicrobiia bacterium]
MTDTRRHGGPDAPVWSDRDGHRPTIVTVALLVVVLLLAGSCAADDGSGADAAAPPDPDTPFDDDGAGDVYDDPTAREGTDAAAPPFDDPDGPTDTSPPADDVPTAEAAGRCWVDDWSLDRQLRTLVFATVTTASRTELDSALGRDVGGVFISSAAVPLVVSGDVASATATATAAAALTPLVAIDEEGGRVQRLRGHLGAVPSARSMAGSMSVDEVRDLARRHGRELRALGITVNFAPVVDVSSQPAGAVIGDRSFAADPAAVVAYAGAFAEGLEAAGVIPTLKHFPGHGRASGDSHDEVVTTPPLTDLDADLRPYRELLGRLEAPMVMVGHLRVPGSGSSEVATTSPELVTGLLRGDLGFDGVVVSDDLGAMRGILDLYSVEEASVRAVAAGVDMVLVPTASIDSVVDALRSGVADGRLSAEQVADAAERVVWMRAGGVCPAR